VKPGASICIRGGLLTGENGTSVNRTESAPADQIPRADAKAANCKVRELFMLLSLPDAAAGCQQETGLLSQTPAGKKLLLARDGRYIFKAG